MRHNQLGPLIFVFAVAGCGNKAGFLFPEALTATLPPLAGHAQSEPQAVVFTNRGDLPIVPSSSAIKGDSALIIIGDECSLHSVPGGAQCRVWLALDGHATGDYRGTLSVRMPPPDIEALVLVSGSVAAPKPEVTPPMTVDVFQGDPFPHVLITVRNAGGGTLGPVVLAVSDSTTFSDGCKGESLVGGASCDVLLMLPAPSLDSTPETTTRTVTVSADPGGSIDVPVSMRVNLTGTLTTAGAATSTPANTATTLVVNFANPGPETTAPLTVVLDENAGNPAQDAFRVYYDGCTGTELAPLGHCTLWVAATPTTVAHYAATVTVGAINAHSAVAALSVDSTP